MKNRNRWDQVDQMPIPDHGSHQPPLHPVMPLLLAAALLAAAGFGLVEHQDKVRYQKLSEAYKQAAIDQSKAALEAGAYRREPGPTLSGVTIEVPHRGPLDLDKLRAAGATGHVHCYLEDSGR